MGDKLPESDKLFFQDAIAGMDLIETAFRTEPLQTGGRLGQRKGLHGGRAPLDGVGLLAKPLPVSVGNGLTDLLELAVDMLDGAELTSAVLSRDICLLYYPVYLLRFQVGQIRGTAAIDATTGAVVSSRCPDAGVRAHDRRVIGLAALASGFLIGSIAHVALFPPQILGAGDTGGFRARLLIVACLLAAGAVAGLGALIRHLKARHR